MTILLLILFGLTLIGGAYLLSYVLVEKHTPKGIAIIHGSMGGIAIVALLAASFFYHTLFYVLILFILVALGGLILLSYDLLGKKIPKSLAIGHGLMAIVGFIALAFTLFHFL